MLKEKNRKEAEHVAYQVLVESLQKTVDEQKEQLSNIEEKSQLDNTAWQKEKKDICEKYEKELNSVGIIFIFFVVIMKDDVNDFFFFQLRKKYELANNEKNDAVMRYVKNESELISIKEEKDNLLKKFKHLQNENQDQIKKYKILVNEKNSLTQSLDSKVQICSFCINQSNTCKFFNIDLFSEKRIGCIVEKFGKMQRRVELQRY